MGRSRNPVASAQVQLQPDLSAFGKQLQTDLNTKIAALQLEPVLLKAAIDPKSLKTLKGQLATLQQELGTGAAVIAPKADTKAAEAKLRKLGREAKAVETQVAKGGVPVSLVGGNEALVKLEAIESRVKTLRSELATPLAVKTAVGQLLDRDLTAFNTQINQLKASAIVEVTVDIAPALAQIAKLEEAMVAARAAMQAPITAGGAAETPGSTRRGRGRKTGAGVVVTGDAEQKLTEVSAAASGIPKQIQIEVTADATQALQTLEAFEQQLDAARTRLRAPLTIGPVVSEGTVTEEPQARRRRGAAPADITRKATITVTEKNLDATITKIKTAIGGLPKELEIKVTYRNLKATGDAIEAEITRLKGLAKVNIATAPVTTRTAAVAGPAATGVPKEIKVQVTSNVTGLLGQVRKQIKDLQPKLPKLQVKVTPNFTGFLGAVQKFVRDFKAPPLRVPVTPDTTSFKGLLTQEVAAAVGGTRAPPVPVSPVVSPDGLKRFRDTIATRLTNLRLTAPVLAKPSTDGFTKAMRDLIGRTARQTKQVFATPAVSATFRAELQDLVNRRAAGVVVPVTAAVATTGAIGDVPPAAAAGAVAATAAGVTLAAQAQEAFDSIKELRDLDPGAALERSLDRAARSASEEAKAVADAGAAAGTAADATEELVFEDERLARAARLVQEAVRLSGLEIGKEVSATEASTVAKVALEQATKSLERALLAEDEAARKAAASLQAEATAAQTAIQAQLPARPGRKKEAPPAAPAAPEQPDEDKRRLAEIGALRQRVNDTAVRSQQALNDVLQDSVAFEKTLTESVENRNAATQQLKTVQAATQVSPDVLAQAAAVEKNAQAVVEEQNARVQALPSLKNAVAATRDLEVVSRELADIQSGLSVSTLKQADAEKLRDNAAQLVNKTEQKRLALQRLSTEAGKAGLVDLERNAAARAQSVAELNAEAAAVRRNALGRVELIKFTDQQTRAESAGSTAKKQSASLSQLLTTIDKFLKQGKLQTTDAIYAEIQAFKASVAAKQLDAAASAEVEAQSQRAAAAAARQAAAESRRSAQFQRGALATTASFAGLRGAVLAASAPFLLATVAVTALGKALQSAAGFEQQLDVFRATAGATAEQMEKVRDTARALGADLTLPAVTSSDAAEAMTELSKAGLSVQDSLSGSRGVLQLATAAAIENAQAVEIAASALNAFGLEGSEAVHVADVLTNAANAAQGSIADMGVALSQAAAVARQVGFSLEDTAALLTLFARNGLRGSDAGTSLRTALVRLIKPGEQASAAIRSLGIDIRDANGNIRSDVFAQFGEATKDLPPALRDATAALIFGQDAIRAVAIAAREGRDGLAEARNEMDKQGSAAELAAARNEGLRGAVEGLNSTIATLGTSLASIGVGPLAEFVRLTTKLLPTAVALAGAFLGVKVAQAAAAKSQQTWLAGTLRSQLVEAGFSREIANTTIATAKQKGTLKALTADRQAATAAALREKVAELELAKAKQIAATATAEEVAALEAEVVALETASASATKLAATESAAATQAVAPRARIIGAGVDDAALRAATGGQLGAAAATGQAAQQTTAAAAATARYSAAIDANVIAASAAAAKQAALGGTLVGTTASTNAAAAATGRLAIAMRAGAVAAGIMGTALRTVWAAMGGYIGLALGLAAAIYWIVTRSSEAEKAQKRLGDAIQAATDAMLRQKTAQDQLKSSREALPGLRRNEVQAIAEVAALEAQLAATPRGTLDRVRVEAALTEARIKRRKATEELWQTQNDIAAQERETTLAAKAKEKADNARTQEIISNFRRVRDAELSQLGGRRRSGAPGTFIDTASSSAAKARAKAVKEEVARLRERATTLEQTGKQEDNIAANNLRLVAKLIEQQKKLPSRKVLELILDNKDVRRSLDQILQEKPFITVGIKMPVQDLAKRLKSTLSLVGVEGINVEPALMSLVDALAKRGPEGERVIQEYGRAIVDAFAEGVSDEAERSQKIRDAKETLADTLRETNEAFISSVRSARSNFESLGSTVADQVSSIIEAASPFSTQISKIDAALGKLSEKTGERNATSRLREARSRLRDARRSIVNVGELTPAEQKGIAEFLEPFINDVKDAEAALQEFRLNKKKGELEDMRDAARDAAIKGIEKLTVEFQEGRLNANEFAKKLRMVVGPALDNLSKNGRNVNLGFMFTQNFQRNMAAFVEQARLVAGYMSVAGTIPGPDVTDPSKTLAENRRKIADAQKALNEAMAATSTNTKDTVEWLKKLHKIMNRRLPPPAAQPPRPRGQTGAQASRTIRAPGEGRPAPPSEEGHP